jgi:2,3-bisphosphoglycerate-dependent phosphoglycerate mutase
MSTPTSANLLRRLILVRHGQSTFNAEDRFTGWRDPHLTARGEDEARAVGQHLIDGGVAVDVVFTSAFQRTIRSAEIILAALRDPAQVQSSAALDERDYGELTGLNKAEAVVRWGADRVQEWRRSYVIPPPGGESLRDTVARSAPFYLREILPLILRGSSVLVVSHGNTLRTLVSALEGLPQAAVESLEIATGELLMYDVAADARLTRMPAVTTRLL